MLKRILDERDIFASKYVKAKKCNKLSKMVAAFSFAGMLAMAVYALLTRHQNKKYKEKIIEMSENFPIAPEQEAELAEIRQREWAAACSPSNRKTTEERIADNRVYEEE